MVDEAINSRGAKLATAKGMAQARLEVAAHPGTIPLMLISKRSLILGAGAAIITRRALALPPAPTSLRNPLAYPGRSILPGFNPNHPASKGIRLSTVASDNSAITIIAPGATGPGATSGSPTFKVFGLLGPSINLTSGGWGWPCVNEKPSSFTCAAIFYNTTTNATGFLLNNNAGTNANGVSIGLNAGVPCLFNNSTGIQPSFGAVGQDYYFLAASTNGVICNWVLKVLHTGAQFAFTFSQASTFGTPTGGFYGLGNLAANIAACSYSINNVLSLPQLEQWAAAPWDFWYPPTQQSLDDVWFA